MGNTTGAWMASVTTGGLIVVAIAMAVVLSQVAHLSGHVQHLGELYQQRRERMQTLTENVTTTSGRVITVTTTRGENETIDAFIGRHNEAVTAARAL